MNVLIGIIIFNTLVLGINFCFLLVGGPPWHKGPEFEPVKMGKRTYSVERFTVGVSISVLGASWLAAWVYFMIASEQSLAVLLSNHFLHIFLQLVASISMITAGIGIFRQWNRNKGIFLMSMGIFVGSTLFAIFLYGPVGHNTSPMFMYLLAIWTLVFGGIFTTATYLLGRLIHNYDERLTDTERIK